MNRDLIRTTAFIRALRRFLRSRPQMVTEVEAALQMLSEDAFDPQLKTHKLSGELAGIWACSAGYDLRILFEFIKQGDAEAILLLTVGTHDDVY